MENKSEAPPRVRRRRHYKVNRGCFNTSTDDGHCRTRALERVPAPLRGVVHGAAHKVRFTVAVGSAALPNLSLGELTDVARPMALAVKTAVAHREVVGVTEQTARLVEPAGERLALVGAVVAVEVIAVALGKIPVALLALAASRVLAGVLETDKVPVTHRELLRVAQEATLLVETSFGRLRPLAEVLAAGPHALEPMVTHREVLRVAQQTAGFVLSTLVRVEARHQAVVHSALEPRVTLGLVLGVSQRPTLFVQPASGVVDDGAVVDKGRVDKGAGRRRGPKLRSGGFASAEERVVAAPGVNVNESRSQQERG